MSTLAPRGGSSANGGVITTTTAAAAAGAAAASTAALVEPFETDEMRQFLFLRVAAARAYPHVEKWLTTTTIGLLSQSVEEAEAAAALLQTNVAASVETIQQTRRTVTKDVTALQRKVETAELLYARLYTASNAWIAGLLAAADSYLTQLGVMEVALEQRHAEAEAWDCEGGERVQVQGKICRFKEKRAALELRMATDRARRETCEGAEDTARHIIYRQCIKAIRDVVMWSIERRSLEAEYNGSSGVADFTVIPPLPDNGGEESLVLNTTSTRRRRADAAGRPTWYDVDKTFDADLRAEETTLQQRLDEHLKRRRRTPRPLALPPPPSDRSPPPVVDSIDEGERKSDPVTTEEQLQPQVPSPSATIPNASALDESSTTPRHRGFRLSSSSPVPTQASDYLIPLFRKALAMQRGRGTDSAAKQLETLFAATAATATDEEVNSATEAAPFASSASTNNTMTSPVNRSQPTPPPLELPTGVDVDKMNAEEEAEVLELVQLCHHYFKEASSLPGDRSSSVPLEEADISLGASGYNLLSQSMTSSPNSPQTLSSPTIWRRLIRSATAAAQGAQLPLPHSTGEETEEATGVQQGSGNTGSGKPSAGHGEKGARRVSRKVQRGAAATVPSSMPSPLIRKHPPATFRGVKYGTLLQRPRVAHHATASSAKMPNPAGGGPPPAVKLPPLHPPLLQVSASDAPKPASIAATVSPKQQQQVQKVAVVSPAESDLPRLSGSISAAAEAQSSSPPHLSTAVEKASARGGAMAVIQAAAVGAVAPQRSTAKAGRRRAGEIVPLPAHLANRQGDQLSTTQLEQLVKYLASERVKADESMELLHHNADDWAASLQDLRNAVSEVVYENIQLEKTIDTLRDASESPSTAARAAPLLLQAKSSDGPGAAEAPKGHKLSPTTMLVLKDKVPPKTWHSRGPVKSTASLPFSSSAPAGATTTAAASTTTTTASELSVEQETVLLELEAAIVNCQTQLAAATAEIASLEKRISVHDAMVQCVAEYWRRNAASMKKQRFARESAIVNLRNPAERVKELHQRQSPSSSSPSTSSAHGSGDLPSRGSSSIREQTCAALDVTTSSQYARVIAQMEAVSPLPIGSALSLDLPHQSSTEGSCTPSPGGGIVVAGTTATATPVATAVVSPSSTHFHRASSSSLPTGTAQGSLTTLMTPLVSPQFSTNKGKDIDVNVEQAVDISDSSGTTSATSLPNMAIPPLLPWKSIPALQLEALDEIAEFIYSVFEVV